MKMGEDGESVGGRGLQSVASVSGLRSCDGATPCTGAGFILTCRDRASAWQVSTGIVEDARYDVC